MKVDLVLIPLGSIPVKWVANSKKAHHFNRMILSNTFLASFPLVKAISRSRTNARIIKTLILLALLEFRIFDAYRAPCSVKTSGGLRLLPHLDLDVAIYDLKIYAGAAY